MHENWSRTTPPEHEHEESEHASCSPIPLELVGLTGGRTSPRPTGGTPTPPSFGKILSPLTMIKAVILAVVSLGVR